MHQAVGKRTAILQVIFDNKELQPMKRKLCHQLESENDLPMFVLNAPVTKVKKCTNAAIYRLRINTIEGIVCT